MAAARSVMGVLLAVFLSGSAGCSMFFARGAPTRVERGEEVHCTQSAALPVIDGVVAGLEVARTVYALTLNDSAYANLPYNRSTDIVLGVGLATLYTVSAGVGASRVSSCKELLAKIGPQPGRRRLVGPTAPTPQWTPSGIKVKHEDDASEKALEDASVAQARARTKAADAAKAAGESATPTSAPPSAGAPSNQE